MLKIVAAALVLALSSQLTYGSPLTPTPGLTAVTSTFSFPGSVRALGAHTTDRSVTTKRGAVGSIAARQEPPPFIVLCAESNCEECASFSLSIFPENECTFVGAFESVGISEPTDAPLPFNVGVGENCTDEFLIIPAVNECFNIIGVPSFNDFETFTS